MLENVSWVLIDLAQEAFVQPKLSLDAADYKMEGVHTAQGHVVWVSQSAPTTKRTNLLKVTQPAKK